MSHQNGHTFSYIINHELHELHEFIITYFSPELHANYTNYHELH